MYRFAHYHLSVPHTGGRDTLPPDLSSLQEHSLASSWGINWISNRDTEWVKLMFQCPVGGPFTYTPPSEGKPELGAVIVTCRAHREHEIVWSERLARQIEFNRPRP